MQRRGRRLLQRTVSSHRHDLPTSTIAVSGASGAENYCSSRCFGSRSRTSICYAAAEWYSLFSLQPCRGHAPWFQCARGSPHKPKNTWQRKAFLSRFVRGGWDPLLRACIDETGPRNLIEIRLKQLAVSIHPRSAECCPRGRSNGGLTPNAGTCARLGARPSRCRARRDDPDPSLVAVVVPLNITIVSSWQARWKRSWSRYSPPRLRSVR